MRVDASDMQRDDWFTTAVMGCWAAEATAAAAIAAVAAAVPADRSAQVEGGKDFTVLLGYTNPVLGTETK